MLSSLIVCMSSAANVNFRFGKVPWSISGGLQQVYIYIYVCTHTIVDRDVAFHKVITKSAMLEINWDQLLASGWSSLPARGVALPTPCLQIMRRSTFQWPLLHLQSSKYPTGFIEYDIVTLCVYVSFNFHLLDFGRESRNRNA